MEYSNLGATDLKVSKICLGTMTWGEQNTEADGHEQMDYALEQGVNFWDTAEMYSVATREETQGSTERIIGTWFKKSGKRDQVILATKIAGPSPRITWVRDGKLDFSRASIFAAIETSLQRLQTDYVDLYQLHWPERKTNFFGTKGYKHRSNDPWQDNFAEIVDAMNDLVKQGKIRYYGISNETPWGVMRYLQASDQQQLPRPVSIQNPYSLLNRLFEIGLAEMAIREKVGLLAYSPMAFGLLSGKYHKGKDQPRDRMNLFGKVLPRYHGTLSKSATAAYIKIAESYNITPAQLSLAWVNSRPFVTSNIIGATTMEQLKENIDSINVKITPELEKAINTIHTAISNPAP